MQVVYYEDQNTILSRQWKFDVFLIRRLNRKQSDIKKLNMQIINTEHQVLYYRQLLSKYNIQDASWIERYSFMFFTTDRIASTNRSLQEEAILQQKKMYALEQQLYLLSKENERLKMKNQSLMELMNSRKQLASNELSKEELSKTGKLNNASKRRISLWTRIVNFFKKKKLKKKSLKIKQASQIYTRKESSENKNRLLKEDIRMMRRKSSQESKSNSEVENTQLIQRVKNKTSNIEQNNTGRKNNRKVEKTTI